MNNKFTLFCQHRGYCHNKYSSINQQMLCGLAWWTQWYRCCGDIWTTCDTAQLLFCFFALQGNIWQPNWYLPATNVWYRLSRDLGVTFYVRSYPPPPRPTIVICPGVGTFHVNYWCSWWNLGLKRKIPVHIICTCQLYGTFNQLINLEINWMREGGLDSHLSTPATAVHSM